MRFVKNLLIFLLILFCLWLAALIVKKSFQSPVSCLTDEIEATHPDYARCILEKAENGDVQSMYKLALMYDVGDRIPENRQEAIRWMQKAGNANLPDAQYVIAVWAERDYFGETGRDLIVPLYLAAAEQGHLNAMKSLVNIYRENKNEKQAQYWMKRIQEAQ